MSRHCLLCARVPDLTRCRSASVSIDLAPLQEELLDILSSAADLSNKLVAKAISYRSEQLAQLDLPSFLVFFNQSWDFVIKCEVICRRMIMGLRGTILGQVGLCPLSLLDRGWLTIVARSGQIIPAGFSSVKDQSIC